MSDFPDIKVVSDEEAAQADFCVCAEPSAETEAMFSDNVHTTCSNCMRAIVHRPYMPKNVKKICIACAVEMAQADLETHH